MKRGQTNRMTAIVDADVMVYQACEQCLREERCGDNEWTYILDEREVRSMIRSRTAQVEHEVGADKVIMCVGSAGNWRKRMCETYKANRAGKRKPLGYGATIEWLRGEYDVRSIPWLEADDVIGLLHTDPYKTSPTVVVSNDKDMRTLPGLLYNHCKPKPAIETISVPAADAEHFMLALMGDVSDGYAGCRGIGRKGAEKIIGPCCRVSEMWEAALAAFEEAGHDEQYALMQLRLARVLRHGEYDAKRAVVKLWTPLWVRPKKSAANRQEEFSVAGNDDGSAGSKPVARVRRVVRRR